MPAPVFLGTRKTGLQEPAALCTFTTIAAPVEHPFAYLFERFPSFVQTFCYREVREMVSQGVNPLIVSLRQPDDAPNLAEPLNLPVFYPPSEKSLRKEVDDRLSAGQLPWLVKRAIKRNRDLPDSQRVFEAAWLGPLLRGKKIRHVHAHFGGLATRTAWWLRKLHGISYSYTGHANDIFCEHGTPLANDDLVRGATMIVTETDFARRWLEEHHPKSKNKTVRVFNGIEIPEMQEPAVKTQPPLILSVGRYVEKKGFSVLIDACRLLRDEGSSFRCKIVGDGPLKTALQAQIDSHDLGGMVQLTGSRSQAEVQKLLRSATLFVLACVNDSEGGSDNLPTVIVEAMAAGVPVITSNIAGIPEMIITRSTGLLVEPNRSGELAKALQCYLSTCGDELDQIGLSARKLALEQFQLSKIVHLLRQQLASRCAVNCAPDKR